jgi:multiple sugar transport system permease protein
MASGRSPQGAEAFGPVETLQGVSVDIASDLAGSPLGPLPVAIFCSFFVDYYVFSLTGAVKE